MHAMLSAGQGGGEVQIRSRIERPPVLSEEDARSLWAGADF